MGREWGGWVSEIKEVGFADWQLNDLTQGEEGDGNQHMGSGVRK